MGDFYERQASAVRRLVERRYRPEDKSPIPERAIKWVVRGIPVLVFISCLAAAMIAGRGR